MARYEDVGDFTLGKNTYKQEGDRTPDYTGTIKLADGTTQRIGAWVQTNSKTGEKFFSGKVTIDTESGSTAPQEQEVSNVEDIPF